MTDVVNDHLVLLSGKSAAGKSASLMGLNKPENKPEGVWYANTEAGKKLPFRAKFRQFTINDPMQIYELFAEAENHPEVHTIVIDSLTYLMEMYESIYVLPSTNTMAAWGQFAQYFKNLMQQYVATSTKNVVFIAHTVDELNEEEMVRETKVPIKGSLKNNGIESYFTCVISAKKKKLKDLEGYSSELLNISPEEEALGFKYVFQTKLTKDTVNERLRGPLGLWETEETFIDNNMATVFNRLHEYYQD